MLYQSFLGAWPLSGIDDGFIERVQSFAIKAAREGKEQTNWSTRRRVRAARTADHWSIPLRARALILLKSHLCGAES